MNKQRARKEVNELTRRAFLGNAAVAALWAALPSGTRAAEVKDMKWKKGHFQIHFINPSQNEAQLLILPDGTTVMIDCGSPNSAGYIKTANPSCKPELDYFVLSHLHPDHDAGLPFLARKVDVRKVLDRDWPDYTTPGPVVDWCQPDVKRVKESYAVLQERCQTKIEKFRVGARDQIVPLHDPSVCTGFEAFNLCANGRFARKDGTIGDIYADRTSKSGDIAADENAVSIGHIFRYGKFSYYSAADFSGFHPDAREPSKYVRHEALLAEELSPVDVAKLDHHGCNMSATIIKALSARVWTVCQFMPKSHLSERTFLRLIDRNVYAGERMVIPAFFAEHLAKLSPEQLADIPELPRKHPVNIVIDVPPGGETYTVALGKREYTMTAPEVAFEFKSRG